MAPWRIKSKILTFWLTLNFWVNVRSCKTRRSGLFQFDDEAQAGSTSTCSTKVSVQKYRGIKTLYLILIRTHVICFNNDTDTISFSFKTQSVLVPNPVLPVDWNHRRVAPLFIFWTRSPDRQINPS
ncbi:LOW QUALITY PROTEIN: hypothetical protein TorRG33x02_108240 [Trema orientale]|uniref:Secreted protein n=1 Tax=Trema orientale TaxID=63057 RepID=A0A2P5F637_TREOI|nr:LOW QUALITY PROTEIN: hypothetical protein TorRG33x02_108240 [Trema orientale]